MKRLSGVRDWPAVKALFAFVWRISARDQVLLSVLATAVFLVDLIPLELQRRITNAAVDKHDFKIVVLYCAGYAACAALLGGLKFAMSVYRGAVTERTNRDLRLDENLTGMTRAGNHGSAEEEGVAISVVVSEVESVGGFVASSISEPASSTGSEMLEATKPPTASTSETTTEIATPSSSALPRLPARVMSVRFSSRRRSRLALSVTAPR